MSSTTCNADRPAAKLVDEPADDGAGAHVEPAEEAAHPRHGALVGIKVQDQDRQEHAEADWGHWEQQVAKSEIQRDQAVF